MSKNESDPFGLRVDLGPLPCATTPEEQKAGRRGTTAWREGYEDGVRAGLLLVESVFKGDLAAARDPEEVEAFALVKQIRETAQPSSPLSQARALLQRARPWIGVMPLRSDGDPPIAPLRAEIDAFLAGLPVTSKPAVFADERPCPHATEVCGLGGQIGWAVAVGHDCKAGRQ